MTIADTKELTNIVYAALTFLGVPRELKARRIAATYIAYRIIDAAIH